MSQESKKATDHDEIRAWVEARKGVPATVKGTERAVEESGILRIAFPEYSEESSLDQITWEEFFHKFEESKLAFLYQEQTKEGAQSRFFKFVRR
jgi:hypothetical protein